MARRRFNLQSIQREMIAGLNKDIGISMCGERKNKMICASDGFGQYLKLMQQRIKDDTGKKYSAREITSFIAAERPIININLIKKRK